MRNGQRRKIPWWLAWGIQAVGVLTLYWLLTWTVYVGRWAYDIALWGIVPAIGMYSAYWATKCGLSNYLAWLMPPVMLWCSHSISYAYSPDMGATLLCAFVSIVGAAAGEVRKISRKNRGRG